MRYDENEKIIKDALGTIVTPHYDFKKEVRNKIITKQQPRITRKKRNIGLIATVIVILSVTVLASTIPSISRLVSIISPEMAVFLQPIHEKSKAEITPKIEIKPEEGVLAEQESGKSKETLGAISEGIEIKPLAVVNDDDMMIIYLTIQDLIGDRINEVLSVQEYFVEGGTINNCQLIDYDKESRTAIVQLTTQGGEKLNNTSIELEIKSLLTGRKELEQLPIDIDLSEIIEISDSQAVWMSRADTMGGGGTGEAWNILEEAGRIKVLKPNQMQLDIPEIEGVIISNIGFIDRKLHIQTKWETNDKDRHGYFYLADKEGKKIKKKENNFYFGVDENDTIQFGREYIEYILEISKEQVKDTKLQGYFAEDGEVIEGKWNIEIDLNAVGKIIRIPCDIQEETWQIKEVILSPLGVTLKGEGEGTETEKIECHIKLKSGEVEQFDSVSTSNQSGDIIMKFTTQIPIDISEIIAIQVNENIIKLN